MPVQKKTSIYFTMELSLREISFVVYVHALMTQKSCAVGMRNAILRNHLRWPNTVFARALADAIERAHKDCKNKHAVDTLIILFAQCPLYLCDFSS